MDTLPATKSLKIMLLNAENLFLLSDQKLEKSHLQLSESEWQKLSTSIYANKPLQKCLALAKVISQVDPDIVMLAEVGGPESLVHFNELFLNNNYSTAVIEGNSDRSIDVGYLIRKNVGFYFDLVSNKNRPINYLYPHEKKMESENPLKSHRFSRDVAELHLFNRERNRPFMVLLLTHLKSRLDPDGIDPQGFSRRQAELKTLVEIYSELETRLQQQIPVVVAGDFNGNASPYQTDLEFQDLYTQTQLADVCALAQLSPENRATYYQVQRHGKNEGRQIDFCFLSPLAARFLAAESVQVYRYQDHLGQAFPPPVSLDAKMLLPSDHYPVIFQLRSLPIVD